MFTKSNPLIQGLTNSSSSSTARTPAPQLRPVGEKREINLLEIRREILLFYDRWTRTDSGGYIRNLKSLIGVLEDMDTIANMNSILPNSRGSVWFSREIEKKCLHNLTEKFNNTLKQLEESLRIHNVTKDAIKTYVDRVRASHNASDQLEQICAYLEAMHEAILHLIECRQKILKRIKSAYPPISFSKNFEELSLFLVIIAESTEEYIPDHACSVLLSRSANWVVPRTLEQVRRDDGRNLFQKEI